MIRLAKQYGWYGYRKVTALLRMEGWHVNHKRIERLWNEEGLQLPRRHKKRKRLSHLPLLSGYDEPETLSDQVILFGPISADGRQQRNWSFARHL